MILMHLVDTIPNAKGNEFLVCFGVRGSCVWKEKRPDEQQAMCSPRSDTAQTENEEIRENRTCSDCPYGWSMRPRPGNGGN